MAITRLGSGSPAVDRALEFVKAGLRAGMWRSGSRLPPMRELARSALVSVNSMWRAVGRARDERLVLVTKGGYITAAGDPSAPGESVGCRSSIDRGRSWQRIRSVLEQDIVSGHFQEHGELPSGKELQARYGMCATTRRKVLVSLCERGVLVPFRKGYRPAVIPKRRFRSTIVFVSEGIGTGTIGIHNERMRKIIDALEVSCGHMGLAVDYVEFSLAGAGRPYFDFVPPPKSDAILGYVLNLPELGKGDLETRAAAMVQWLVACRKPVAVLDMMGVFMVPETASARVRVFRPAAYAAGAGVGRFLNGLGHTHIAYISLYHQGDWSKLRMAGLESQYPANGAEPRVVPFVRATREYESHSAMLRALTEEQMREVEAISLSRDAAGFARTLPSVWNRRMPVGSNPQSSAGDLAVLHSLASSKIDPDMFTVMREAALQMALSKRTEALTQPLLKAAAADKQITAWVCANDGIAFSALRYLSRERIAVPHSISVVGFDNLPETFETKLTTYDFGLSGIIHRMLWFVTHPNFGGGRRLRGAEEVAGMIIERKTTGHAVGPTRSEQ